MTTNTVTEQTKQQLIDTAINIAPKAYAPYSHFHVGAALLADNDQVYTGVNVENQSYGLTICAERSAVVKMVTDGCTGIKAIAVSTTSGASPCGACRQVLQEFISKDLKDFPVYIHNSTSGQVISTSMNTILPQNCDLKELLTERHSIQKN
jgi:cytidine deaminase